MITFKVTHWVSSGWMINSIKSSVITRTSAFSMKQHTIYRYHFLYSWAGNWQGQKRMHNNIATSYPTEWEIEKTKRIRNTYPHKTREIEVEVHLYHIENATRSRDEMMMQIPIKKRARGILKTIHISTKRKRHTFNIGWTTACQQQAWFSSNNHTSLLISSCCHKKTTTNHQHHLYHESLSSIRCRLVGDC